MRSTLRVGGLAGEIDAMSGVVGGLQEDAAAGEPTTGVNACLIAPQANGVEGFGGIGVAFITWANPLRACSNFASATIYRNTVDDFISSAMVGQSEWISFLDESVTDGTVYYYWVTWTLTNGSVGPPSESVMVRTGFDPDRFHDELLADVRDDPLTRDLLSDITLPETIAAEIRRLAIQRSLILSDLVNIINATQVAQQQEITALEATLTGTMLGPVQNRFTGTDRAAAETARDDYEAINPMVEYEGVMQAWIDHYDAEDDLNIILQYGVVLQYQHRVSGVWENNGEEQALASAVTTLAADVTSLQGEVMAFSTMLTQLQADIAGKAEASAVTALDVRVGTTETATTAQAQQIISLGAAVQDKAEASAVTALTTRVQSNEGSISSQSTQISSLLAQAIGFAAAAAVMELAARVTVNEDGITSVSSLINDLSSMIGDSASALALSLLESRVVTVEGQTVSQGTAITSLNASVAALVSDILTRATAAAVTVLTARVTATEGSITGISSSVTQLMADIMDRATAAAVTALTARVATNEGGITSLSSAVTTLLADIPGLATVLAQEILEARVELVENVDGSTTISQLARWLVKTQVGDLVGGIGLYNDGNSVRLTIAADRFVVLPPGFLGDDDARVPFAVVGGQVYMDDAVIRDASIGTAKIINGFLTNLAAVHGTIQFARITKGDIFDLTINNIIQSVNYIPDVSGWYINRGRESGVRRRCDSRHSLRRAHRL